MGKEKLKKTKIKSASKSNTKKLTEDASNSGEERVIDINGGAAAKLEKMGGKKKSKRDQRKNSALSEISRKVLNSIDLKANSPGEGKALLEDSVNSEVFAEEGDEQLDLPESEVGSILKK